MSPTSHSWSPTLHSGSPTSRSRNAIHVHLNVVHVVRTWFTFRRNVTHVLATSLGTSFAAPSTERRSTMNVNPQYIWVAVAAIGALVVMGLVAAGVRRSRSARLQKHFGAEYNRTLEATGDRASAERELMHRAEEVKSFEIHALTATQREEYRADWLRIESHFVDRPTTAVVEADELITDVMQTRGYPIADFEQHASHLSVEHPRQ